MDDRTTRDLTGTLGIIGAGHIGQALARTALRAGRGVLISNSRGPASLEPLVASLGQGVAAATVRDAAAAGIVAIAVPWSSVPAAVSGLQWDGQTVIDATNAWTADLGGSGDHAPAKAVVAALFDGGGFFTIAPPSSLHR